MLRPAPVFQRVRKKLKSSARGGEAAQNLPVNLHSYQPSSLRVAVRRRVRNDIRMRRFRGASKDAPKLVNADVLQLYRRDFLFMQRAWISLDFERAMAPHIGERREGFSGGAFRQAWNRIFKNVTIILVHGQFL